MLHVERLTELTEYFVIRSASSTTQVKALADNVEWHLKYDHDEMHHTEVMNPHSGCCWTTAALYCCIHAGGTQSFNLENLWKDGHASSCLKSWASRTSKNRSDMRRPRNVSAALSRSKSKTHPRGESLKLRSPLV